MYVCEYTHAILFIWRSEDTLWELVLSSDIGVPGIELRSSGLAAKPLPAKPSCPSSDGLSAWALEFPAYPESLFISEHYLCDPRQVI